MVAPGVAEDRVTTTAELSAGVVVKIGAALGGKFVVELCAVLPQLALPATTRAAAASALLNWSFLKFDIALISTFALSIVAQVVRGMGVKSRSFDFVRHGGLRSG